MPGLKSSQRKRDDVWAEEIAEYTEGSPRTSNG